MNQNATPLESVPSEARPPMATAERLFALAESGNLSHGGLVAALRFISDMPSRNEWRRFLNMLLLVLGAGFLVAGIFFFFAYNWDGLHDFAKLGIAQGAILLAAALAHYLGLDKLPGKISLTVAALLVGALLALFGQIYQSTADAYTLFLMWALYIVGWVAIGRFAPLWLVLLGLLNAGLLFFWEQTGLSYEYRFEAESVFALNAVALAGWEWFRSRNVPWMQGRWWPRVAAVVAFWSITTAAISYALDFPSAGITAAEWLVAIAYPLFIAAIWYFYRYRHQDFIMLTMMCLSLIGVVTAWVARLLDFDDMIMFFVLAAVVIVQAGFAALWLRNLGEES